MLQPVSTQPGYPVLPLRVLKEAWMGAEEVGREVGDWGGGGGVPDRAKTGYEMSESAGVGEGPRARAATCG